MKKKNRIFLVPALAVAACLCSATTLADDDDDDEELKIRGSAFGLFTYFQNVGLSEGRAVSVVIVEGQFELMFGETLRTGRMAFPHLLVANLKLNPPPEPPDFLDGHVTGGLTMFFDDGTVCDGRQSGDFDETGFGLVARARLDCTDGSQLRLKLTDAGVDPGVSVKSDIRGRQIFREEDDD